MVLAIIIVVTLITSLKEEQSLSMTFSLDELEQQLSDGWIPYPHPQEIHHLDVSAPTTSTGPKLT